jgi:hypothetical protein
MRLEPLGKRRKEFGETEGRKAGQAHASESIARISRWIYAGTVWLLVTQQSSRGLEQSKTLRVFEGWRAARSVLECGSPLPLSATNTDGWSEIL